MKFTVTFPFSLAPVIGWAHRTTGHILTYRVLLLVMALCLTQTQKTYCQTATKTLNVVAWGNNDNGQLGDGTKTNRSLPTGVANTGALSGRTATKLFAGGAHSVAICSDGIIAAWGANGAGQLGTGNTDSQLQAINITNKGVLSGKMVNQLIVGSNHSFALCSDGTLAAWGYNWNGQLGDGTDTNRLLPIAITGNGVLKGKTITQIAAGNTHTLALCSDGTLASWGFGQYGQLGTGANTSQYLPVNITGHGALKGKTIIQIVASESRSMAFCSDGTLAVWGENLFGAVGDGTEIDRNLPVAVNNNGALRGKTVVRIGAGASHTVVLCSDGTLAAWGYNYFGELGDGTTVTRRFPVDITDKGALQGKTITQVAGGAYHTLALCSDGTTIAWGRNYYGELGDGLATSQLLPVDISKKGDLMGKTVIQIAAGGYHNLALTTPTIIVPNAAPTITIATPALKQSLPLSSFNGDTLSGSATDDTGVTKVEVKLYRTRNGINQIWNGSAFTTASATVVAAQSGSGASIIWKMGVEAPSQNQLDAGEYLVIAYARDAQGKIGVARSSFTLTAPVPPTDTQSPVPFISTPTANQSLLISDLTSRSITGGATDNVGVTRIDLKLYRTRDSINEIWNGSSFTTTSITVPATLSGNGVSVGWGMGSKTPPASQLDAGTYSLLVYAQDAAGNIGVARSSFTLMAPIPTDTEKPIPFVSTPAAGQSLLIADLTSNSITGGATDNIGATRVDLKLYRTRDGVNQIWNGTSFSTNSATVPAFLGGSGKSITWAMGAKTPSANQLDAGEYLLIVYALDAAGNLGTARSSFTLSAPLPPPDTQKPVVSITGPTPNQLLLISNFTSSRVTGSATDNVGVVGVDLRLYRTRGGVTQVWNGTSFTTTVTTVPATLSGSGTSVAWEMGAKTPPSNQLDQGAYYLTAYAGDAAGNTAAVTTTFSLGVSTTGTSQ